METIEILVEGCKGPRGEMGDIGPTGPTGSVGEESSSIINSQMYVKQTNGEIIEVPEFTSSRTLAYVGYNPNLHPNSTIIGFSVTFFKSSSNGVALFLLSNQVLDIIATISETSSGIHTLSTTAVNNIPNSPETLRVSLVNNAGESIAVMSSAIYIG